MAATALRMTAVELQGFCEKLRVISKYSVTNIAKVSTSCQCLAGEKYRISKGLARDNLEYGPLTDLPDFTFTDGRKVPLSSERSQREEYRLAQAERITTLIDELDNAKEVFAERIENNEKIERPVLRRYTRS